MCVCVLDHFLIVMRCHVQVSNADTDVYNLTSLPWTKCVQWRVRKGVGGGGGGGVDLHH